MIKNIKLPLIILAVVLIVAAAYFFSQFAKKPAPIVLNFEECAAAGYPILESYPPRCLTPDGKSFTQQIGNELELRDQITISDPRPNQKISSPLRISGTARGTWFFEASFPVKLVDERGNTIAQSHVQAQGEWMSEDFVRYEGKIIFTPKTARGTLILQKDNPSGLPENDKELQVPVVFE